MELGFFLGFLSGGRLAFKFMELWTRGSKRGLTSRLRACEGPYSSAEWEGSYVNRSNFRRSCT